MLQARVVAVFVVAMPTLHQAFTNFSPTYRGTYCCKGQTPSVQQAKET